MVARRRRHAGCLCHNEYLAIESGLSGKGMLQDIGVLRAIWNRSSQEPSWTGVNDDETRFFLKKSNALFALFTSIYGKKKSVRKSLENKKSTEG